MFGAPLRYPAAVSLGTLAICVAWLPFAAVDQIAALVVVLIAVAATSGWRLRAARFDPTEAHQVSVRRVRQQHRLTSRSWLEVTDGTKASWLPVYFDPVLVAMPGPVEAVASRSGVQWGDARLVASGRVRHSEPPGRLIDNPSRTAPDAVARGRTAARVGRRLLLDAQFAVAGPLIGLLWVYVAAGGVGAFVGATCVGAATSLWYSAIRGSDPS